MLPFPFVPPFVASAAQAGRTIEFLQTATLTADLTDYSFLGQNFGLQANDRVLVAVAWGVRNLVRTISSVDIGGGPAAEIVQVANGGQPNGIYAALVAFGATGDIVVRFNADMQRCHIALFRMTGGTSLTPFHVQTDPSANATSRSVALNMPENGCVIGLANTSALTTDTWSGLTERSSANPEGFSTFSSASENVAAAEPNRPISCVWGASGVASMAAASFAPSYDIEYLAVGGGAGGGLGTGGVNFGAGGAGGVVRPGTASVNVGQPLSVTVGPGGAAGADGDASSIGAIVTAPGGQANASGATGGNNADFSGGLNSGTAAGGGAGAGTNGGNAPGGSNGGAGGDGVESSITGTPQRYGGGGGGGANIAGGPGGLGGGGNGTNNGTGAQSGAPNTGGGGGGGNPDTTTGGSGIVIIRYLGPPRGTGGTITQVGGDTIHTFTASGTFTA